MRLVKKWAAKYWVLLFFYLIQIWGRSIWRRVLLQSHIDLYNHIGIDLNISYFSTIFITFSSIDLYKNNLHNLKNFW